MSDLPAERPKEEPGGLAPRRDAEAAVEALRTFLAAPVFQQQIPLALLTKFATDTAIPPRERCRSMQVLAQLQMKAMELLASLTGAREQRLKDLGLEAPAQAVNVTQLNTKIEIVREGARDWRVLESDS